MTPIWLVQEDVFKEECFPSAHHLSSLFSTLDKNDTKYHVYKYIPFSTELQLPCDLGNFVLTYGSLNLIKQVKRTTSWIPGYWCNFEAFRCLHYYAHYGKYLLNKDYAIMPFGELIRRKEELYQQFGDPLFIRPDKGDKPFTGQCITHHEFDSQTKFLLNYCDPELTIIVSSTKKITREWRFIVSGNQVITGSLYIENDDFRENIHQLTESGDAYDYACMVAQEKWKPDPMFAVDIAETSDGLRMLEINSFSASGFYACDKNKIVLEANRVALLELTDIYS